MTRIVMALLVATVVVCTVAMTGGCATTTPAQARVVDTGVRLAAAAYITRGTTQAAMAKRAGQLWALTGAVRAQVHADGGVVWDLEAIADSAAAYLQGRADLSAGDRVLALLVVSEALEAIEAAAPEPDMGAVNAARLLALLDQVDRLAGMIAPPV